MKNLLAVLAVLAVTVGTAVSALPANASTVQNSAPNQYEGANN